MLPTGRHPQSGLRSSSGTNGTCAHPNRAHGPASRHRLRRAPAPPAPSLSPPAVCHRAAAPLPAAKSRARRSPPAAGQPLRATLVQRQESRLARVGINALNGETPWGRSRGSARRGRGQEKEGESPLCKPRPGRPQMCLGSTSSPKPPGPFSGHQSGRAVVYWREAPWGKDDGQRAAGDGGSRQGRCEDRKSSHAARSTSGPRLKGKRTTDTDLQPSPAAGTSAVKPTMPGSPDRSCQ